VLDVAVLYAHPLWLVERWAAGYGLEITEKICAFDQHPPETAVRLREHRQTGAKVGHAQVDVEEELRREGLDLKPGALLRSARRVSKGDVTHTAAFRAGRVAIQDEASQLVALLVGGGRRLLDCCAAPGGKTAILAERSPGAEIIAAEIHPRRAVLLQQRLESVSNVTVLAADATELPVSGFFDRALADVPCSGTGTLARNPEIKWKLKPQDLPELHARQVAILRAALEHLAPGGILVYSSCSLEQEENEHIVDEVLSHASHVRLVDCREQLERLKSEGELSCSDISTLMRGPFLRTVPGIHPCDGFFTAMLRKALP
jgi:16S rRNA (cytosine967-C5)-methyltransferase